MQQGLIEDSIRIYQISLDDKEHSLKEKAKVQERYEEEKAKKHRKKGEERGRKEGEEKAKFDMAKNLLQMGILTTEQVTQVSGL